MIGSGNPARGRTACFVVATLGSLACARGTVVDCAPSPAAASRAGGGDLLPAGTDARRWAFDAPTGSAPDGFELLHTDGPPGHWVIRSRTDAPSAPAALAQEDSARVSSRFAVAAASGATFGDVSLAVRCAAIGGSIDRACGIVWRLGSAENYYLARANALENNVRLYYVRDGRRHEIAGWDGAVTSCTWHSLRADMRGDLIEVYWNGRRVIEARDDHFRQPGRVGLWTKADSRTLFDDLVVRAVF